MLQPLRFPLVQRPLPPLPLLRGRVGVGGTPTALVHDHFQNAIRILEDVIVPETQHQPSVLSEVSIADPVRVGFGMLAAVRFDPNP